MFNPWQSIRNIFRGRQFEKLSEEFKNLLGQDPEIVESFLEVLLGIMSLALWLDKDYHRNIENFRGKYLFRSKSGDISVRAIFTRTLFFRYPYLKVSEGTSVAEGGRRKAKGGSKEKESFLLLPTSDFPLPTSSEDADVTIIFKDSKALMNLLLSPKIDILGSLLRNAVTLRGNVNYILKFGFMATQLQQMILPRG